MSSPGAAGPRWWKRPSALERGTIGVIRRHPGHLRRGPIAALDIPVVQINTGGGCHIDANMVREAMAAST